MKTGSPPAPSPKSFENALLAELLTVHQELQRSQAPSRSLRRARPEPRTGPRNQRRRAQAPPDTAPGRGWRPKAGRRAVVGALAISAATVLGAVALASVRSHGQRVTIAPAAQGGLPPGTVIVAGSNGGVSAFRPGSTGDAAPGTTIIDSLNSPVTMAFDPYGDLWVANENGNNLVEFSKAELTKPNPLPSVIIAPPALTGNPFGMAFDQAGDLWLVNDSSNDIMEFTHSQLARSGSPAPHTTISSTYFRYPIADAFDPSGDLWVANSGRNSLVEYSKAELAKPQPTPTVTISSFRGSLNWPNAVLFDSSGNLWVGNWDTGNDNLAAPGNLVEFTRSELNKSGDPPPAVKIAPDHSGQSIEGPFMAFDPGGNMWVSNWYNSTVVEFTKAQLAKSGTPTPARTIVGAKTGLSSPSYIVVEP